MKGEGETGREREREGESEKRKVCRRERGSETWELGMGHAA